MGDVNAQIKRLKAEHTVGPVKFKDYLRITGLMVILVHVKVLKRNLFGKVYSAIRTFAVSRENFNLGSLLPANQMESPVFRVDWAGPIKHSTNTLLKNGAIRRLLQANERDFDCLVDAPSLLDTRTFEGNLSKLTFANEYGPECLTASIVRIPKTAIDQIVVAVASGKIVWMCDGSYKDRVKFGTECDPTGVYSLDIPRVVELGWLNNNYKWKRVVLEAPTVEIATTMLEAMDHSKSTCINTLECKMCRARIFGSGVSPIVRQGLSDLAPPPGVDHYICQTPTQSLNSIVFDKDTFLLSTNTSTVGHYENTMTAHFISYGLHQFAQGLEFQRTDVTDEDVVNPPLDEKYHACILTVPCYSIDGEIPDVSDSMVTISKFDTNHSAMLKELIEKTKQKRASRGILTDADVTVEIAGVDVPFHPTFTGGAPELSGTEVLRFTDL